ncbi:hypothetical protein M472_00570 [Sphingobacterium paucimobilis HER1398]|uniref:Acyl-CoA dehydrogenase C-terminal domain-containing protein n=2 Tax=Sphingobacterium TaxID=28453 RepID=U2IX22_9SPHI|nr:hypothetical protein M472_00570 [Sphingobacterium paucimobilis HER1398]
MSMMISEEAIQLIKDKQALSIDSKTLVDEQLSLIYDNNWFNIWVPQILGGKELSLQDGLALLEELAYWDGGLGWTVTLCAGANMFAGYLDKDLARKVFADRKVCFGGSGRATGKAVWDGTQYSITGFWRFATGAPHLSHFTLNSFVYDGDKARVDKDGNPVFYSFFVPRDKVLIHYDWDSFGLACTASHSFSLENATVEAHHAFQIDPQHRIDDHVLYRIPFVPFAELTLLVNYMGMYRRYLDLVEKFFFEKSADENWHTKYGRDYFKRLDGLQQQLESDRTKVAALTEQLWALALQDSPLDAALASEITSTARGIVKHILADVVTLFPLLGINAAQNGQEINTVFRNIFTASQHSLLNI